jgi:hypothetical protein
MEITVLDVTVPSGESPPTKPVLAIHAGSVRRQAKLEVNQPFVIPHPGSQCGPVEVSVFQQLASYVIDKEEKTESFCNIPVSKADGQSSQVQLRVRRGEAANSGKKQKADDDMGLARDYLDKHQLQQRIQSLIQDVLREQPDNPYKHMIQQLRQSRGESSATETKPQEAMPMVPRPPEQPKPDGPRARNASSNVAAAKSDKSRGSKDVQVNADSPTIIAIEQAPKTEAQKAARFSVVSLLRMPLCQIAAEKSLRNSARAAKAQSMCALVVNSVKEKLVDEAQRGSVMNPAKRGSVMNPEDTAVLLSPEYHRSLVGWACYIAYRSAFAKLGNQIESRRNSMPTPIVFLQSEASSWGTWLSGRAAGGK